MPWKPRGARDGGPLVGWRLAGGLVLAVVVAVGLGILCFRGLGRWLIVSDVLAHARAIVVLRGRYPFRAMEAAAIYRQGWAPEIWLTRTSEDAYETAEFLLRSGRPPSTENNLNRELLGRLEVPVSAIRVLARDVQNTADELRVVVAELQRSGGTSVIIVTSKPHTRRVRAIWRSAVGDVPAAIVRYTPADPFRAEGWWRYPSEAHNVTRETFGLLSVWVGLSMRPADGK